MAQNKIDTIGYVKPTVQDESYLDRQARLCISDAVMLDKFSCLTEQQKKQYLLRYAQDPSMDLFKEIGQATVEHLLAPTVLINGANVSRLLRAKPEIVNFSRCTLRLAISTRVYAAGDKVLIPHHDPNPFQTPIFSGVIETVRVDYDTTTTSERTILIVCKSEVVIKVDPEKSALARDLDYCYPAKTDDLNKKVVKTLGRLLDKAPRDTTPNDAWCLKTNDNAILSMHHAGDDVLTLHLPDRMTGAPDQVLAVKRWGEVEVKPGWYRKMNDLAQSFWKAVAQVYHDLPLPVSRKQEAILAFCNERKMTLSEFDRQYYAEPARHMQVLEADERGYMGTEQDPTAWAIVRIKKG